MSGHGEKSDNRSCSPPPFLTAAEWNHAIRVISLSPQQAEIVALVLQSKSNRQIAILMGLSIWTVGTYMRRIFHRCGVTDRVGLAAHVFAACRENPTTSKPVTQMGDT